MVACERESRRGAAAATAVHGAALILFSGNGRGGALIQRRRQSSSSKQQLYTQTPDPLSFSLALSHQGDLKADVVGDVPYGVSREEGAGRDDA